ncbi:Rhodanese-related sulfurtransferase [Desulfitobacterium dichloroeliminans LMG P-21439]|uniref:Rhodanese-related sulfurtransferase n=1 Tax=Desulfitobacterium dichloroeliminans (strain LMG P-21439 / DCA1) TaxID=871963 RepID=L0F8Q6_DESDL|nr:rhodanese-like domain-containing protein [Desulfitobacterium dichloroeliminans]AGA69420.1 Rhodanese-related sulfurtransferase [Desulfitobacterium dichloroeliminans LMG P-21439]
MENNYFIFAVVIVVFVFWRRFSIANKMIKNLTTEEAYELIQSNKDVVVIDVRTNNEYRSGHIPGSKSIPVGELSSRLTELQKYKDKPILVHCASGGRSPAALRILLKNNFSQIFHLKRGLIGWNYGLK